MTTVTSDTPITDAELDGLFGGLVAWPVVALAVSGGSDSLALLHLFARWRLCRDDAPNAIVLTIDHGLRPGSASEACFVADQVRRLGFFHETLVWEGPKPSSGIAKAARDARYRLLAERLALEPASPRAIVTAHTQDDQGETLLMRLARGSGLEGLAAMKPARLLLQQTQVWLVRPLLGVPKSRLEATLSAAGQTWINDPTNTDPAFERPRLRQSAALREQAGLSNAALSRTAQRLARANEALDHATDSLDASAVRHDPGLSATLDRALFAASPLELRIRLLDRLLRHYGGCHPAAQLGEIERLADHLARSPKATTLGGCRISPAAQTLIICREPGRHGLPVLELAPGQYVTWDHRFEVSLGHDAPGPCTVRALNEAEWTALRSSFGTRVLAGLTKHTAITLPTFWVDDALIAAPGLGDLELEIAPRRHALCNNPLCIAASDVAKRYQAHSVPRTRACNFMAP